MFPTRRGAVALSLLCFCIVACGIVGSCTPEHPAPTTDDLLVASAAEQYEEAMERVAGWQTDAYLGSVSAIPASSASRVGSSLTFMFGSPSAPNSVYVLDLLQGAWESTVLRKGRGEPMRWPIEPEDWPVDTVDAWHIAQANGGRDFLLAHRDSRTSKMLILEYQSVGTSENVLAWRVLYMVHPARQGGHVDVMIDPKTGDVLEVIAK